MWWRHRCLCVDKPNDTVDEALKRLFTWFHWNVYRKDSKVCKMSHNILRLWGWNCTQFFLNKCFTSLQNTNPNNSIKYQRVLGEVHVKSVDCRNAIHRSLEVNLDAYKIIASLQGTLGMHPEAHTVDLAN